MSSASQTVHHDGNGLRADPLNGPGPGRPAPRWRHPLALLVYLVLTVALTWPLTLHVANKIVIHPRRTILAPYYHLYLVAWYHHVFDEGLANYWNPNIHYPHPRVLAYYESLLVPSAVTWPVHLASHNVVLCYNLIVLSAFVLNALGMYVLALQLGLSWRLALLTGATLAYCPYMFGETYCLAILHLYPVLFLLAALDRLIQRPTWPWAILVGVCGLWLVTTSYQYTLFCSLFCAGWMLWFVRQVPWRRVWFKLLLVGTVCGALVLPLLWTVKRTHHEMRFHHGPGAYMKWLQMLVPATGQRVYHDLLGIRVREDRGDLDPIVCFPGVTFALLAAVGAWAALFGPVRSDLDRRRRHAYRFCLAAGLAAGILAMGLWIRLGPIKVPGPYAVLYLTLSPFSSVRSVYRFYIFGHLFAAILAGVGLRHGLGALTTIRAQRLTGLAVVLLLAVESVWIPLNLRSVGGRPRDVHPLYRRLADMDPNAPLIEVPVPTSVELAPYDALYGFSSIHTWQPLVNGFASYSPGLYEELRPVMGRFPSLEAVRYLRALGVEYILVREALMPPDRVKAIKRFPSLRQVERHQRAVLYKLAGSARRSLNDWQGETRFRIERDPNDDGQARALLEFALDLREVIPVLPGDRATRWTLAWRDPSDRLIKTQTVDIRGSRWLTYERNALGETVELPARPGTYTVQVTDRSDGRTLGACRFEVK